MPTDGEAVPPKEDWALGVGRFGHLSAGRVGASSCKEARYIVPRSLPSGTWQPVRTSDFLSQCPATIVYTCNPASVRAGGGDVWKHVSNRRQRWHPAHGGWCCA